MGSPKGDGPQNILIHDIETLPKEILIYITNNYKKFQLRCACLHFSLCEDNFPVDPHAFFALYVENIFFLIIRVLWEASHLWVGNFIAEVFIIVHTSATMVQISRVNDQLKVEIVKRSISCYLRWKHFRSHFFVYFFDIERGFGIQNILETDFDVSFPSQWPNEYHGLSLELLIPLQDMYSINVQINIYPFLDP